MTIVTVLLPRGTKEEASAARAALEKTGWKLVMGTAHSHTPGQSLSGDVVLIGPGPEALDEDVQGKLWKVPNIEALAKLDIKARKVAKEEPPATEQEQLQNMVTRREVEEPPPPPPAPEPEEEEEDELAGMTRIELMQFAASKWPGERRWSTLNNDALRAAIRELSN